MLPMSTLGRLRHESPYPQKKRRGGGEATGRRRKGKGREREREGLEGTSPLYVPIDLTQCSNLYYNYLSPLIDKNYSLLCPLCQAE